MARTFVTLFVMTGYIRLGIFERSYSPTRMESFNEIKVLLWRQIFFFFFFFFFFFCTSALFPPCFQRKLLALKKLKDLLEFQQKQIFCSRKYTFWGLCPILGVPKIKSRLSDNDVFSCFPEWVVFPLFHIWIQFPEGSWIPGLVLLQLSPSAFRIGGETNPRIWRELDSTYFFWMNQYFNHSIALKNWPSSWSILMKRFMDGTQLVSQQSTNEKSKMP